MWHVKKNWRILEIPDYIHKQIFFPGAHINIFFVFDHNWNTFQEIVPNLKVGILEMYPSDRFLLGMSIRCI